MRHLSTARINTPTHIYCEFWVKDRLLVFWRLVHAHKLDYDREVPTLAYSVDPGSGRSIPAGHMMMMNRAVVTQAWHENGPTLARLSRKARTLHLTIYPWRTGSTGLTGATARALILPEA